MKSLSNMIFIIFGMLLLSSCNPDSGTKKVSTVNTPFASGSMPIRWNLSSVAPLSVKVGDSILADFNAGDNIAGLNPVEQMLEKWDNALTTNVFVYPAPSTTNKTYTNLNSFRDSEFGIYKSTTWFPEVSSSALAITQFFGFQKADSRGNYLELIHADVIFNYRDYSFSTDANSVDDYDFHSVLLHELGHFLGLGHQNDFSIPAVMQPFLSIFDSNRDLFTNDETRILDNYDNFQLTTSSGNQLAISASAGSSTGNDSNVIYQGYIELRTDGTCNHYLEGELIESHHSQKNYVLRNSL